MSTVICDVPARSLIKGTIGHNGKRARERCIVMSFIPICFTHPRPDKSFRTQSDKLHHKGKSLFQKLNIDMVIGFLLDYMDLALLGVMKRLILNWIGGKAWSQT